MEPNIIGYHSNYVGKAQSFVLKNELLSSKDTEYLGEGMYFWDNLSNAHFWAKKKLNEGSVKKVSICKANINLSEPMLDLTDEESIKYIRQLWLSYCEKQNVKNKKQFLGTILDTLRAFFDEINDMKVSKCHGDYSSWTKERFFANDTRNRIDNRPKTIYTVRCISKISNQKIHQTGTIVTKNSKKEYIFES